jgi:hypothetical protein
MAIMLQMQSCGSMKDDLGKIWTLHLFNNFAFNAMPSAMSNGSSLLKDNSNGLMKLTAQQP